MQFSSTIISGFGRGRKIGFPTVNLKIPNALSLKHGVYGCEIDRDGQKLQGILYFGHHFLVDKSLITLEIHILTKRKEQQIIIDTMSPKKEITVKIGSFIRKPIFFQTTKKLIEQIKNDINKLTG